jgi:hypothetical protein
VNSCTVVLKVVLDVDDYPITPLCSDGGSWILFIY